MKHNYVWFIGTRPDTTISPVITEFDFILKEVVSHNSESFIRLKKHSFPQSFTDFQTDLVGSSFKQPLIARAKQIQHKSYPESTHVDVDPPRMIQRIYNRNLAITISSVTEEEGFNCIKLLQMIGQI
jgi:hypothetical protein